MDEINTEFLATMVTDVKEVVSYAISNNMSTGIKDGLESIIGNMQDLRPLIKKKIHKKRIKADLEKLIQELKDCSEIGEEALTMGKMRTLRDRVNILKAIFSQD